MRYFAVLFVLLSLSARAGADQAVTPATQTAVECGEQKNHGKTFTENCTAKNSAQKFSFVISGKYDAENDLATTTKVTVNKDGKKWQELAVDGEEVTPGVDLIDVNFDGNPDLQVNTTSGGAGPNGGYAYWLFNPQTQKFDRRQDLDDELSGAEIDRDAQTKTISVGSRSSCCDWDYSIYAWVDGKLKLQSTKNDGLISPLINIAPEQDGQICGQMIDHYNKQGLITKTDFNTESNLECDGGTLTLAQIEKAIAAKGKAYAVTETKDKGKLTGLTVTYNPPRKSDAN